MNKYNVNWSYLSVGSFEINANSIKEVEQKIMLMNETDIINSGGDDEFTIDEIEEN